MTRADGPLTPFVIGFLYRVPLKGSYEGFRVPLKGSSKGFRVPLKGSYKGFRVL